MSSIFQEQEEEEGDEEEETAWQQVGQDFIELVIL